jgi:N-acetylglutamate synthase-like GNAT family acetyltransferase
MQHIDQSLAFGGASGYVVESSREQVRNYLGDFTDQAPKIAAWLTARVGYVGVLKNLNVDEEARGQGTGTRLLEGFLDEALQHQAGAVILIADADEKQQAGFDLEHWYASHDFTAVMPTSAGPVMVFPSDLGERLKEDLALAQLPS